MLKKLSANWLIIIISAILWLGGAFIFTVFSLIPKQSANSEATNFLFEHPFVYLMLVGGSLICFIPIVFLALLLITRIKQEAPFREGIEEQKIQYDIEKEMHPYKVDSKTRNKEIVRIDSDVIKIQAEANVDKARGDTEIYRANLFKKAYKMIDAIPPDLKLYVVNTILSKDTSQPSDKIVNDSRLQQAVISLETQKSRKETLLNDDLADKVKQNLSGL